MRHPVRLAHLGLGNFHRAHQAWYTHRANLLHPDDGWGIAAFTGTRPDMARALTASDGLYSLVTRAADGDTSETVESLVRAVDGADAPAWRQTLADPELAVVTVTVTEPGYRTTPDGRLNLDDPAVQHDLEALRRGGEGAMITAPARLLDGIISRRAAAVHYADAAPLAIVSCDNLSGNGAVLRAVVTEFAHAVDNGVAAWVTSHVSFPSTMVDRITPASPEPLVVVTEPFSEWVIAGEFPAGRPAWDEVGVRFVDDVAPYERRKLWLLNAGHSTLAYLGLLRGLETVDQAFADPELRASLELLWTEARAVLELSDAETDAALDALRVRFANPRIAHRLSQIALSGREKLEQRQRAIIRARVAAGLTPGEASEATIAAYDELVTRGTIRVD